MLQSRDMTPCNKEQIVVHVHVQCIGHLAVQLLQYIRLRKVLEVLWFRDAPSLAWVAFLPRDSDLASRTMGHSYAEGCVRLSKYTQPQTKDAVFGTDQTSGEIAVSISAVM